MNRKNILAIAGAVLIALAMIATVTVFASEATDLSADSEIATFSEANIPSETTSTTDPEEEVVVLEPVEVERVEPTTYDEAIASLEKAIARQELTNTVYQGLQHWAFWICQVFLLCLPVSVCQYNNLMAQLCRMCMCCLQFVRTYFRCCRIRHTQRDS